MISFSTPYRAQEIRKGTVFSARQYPQAAFAGLADPVLQIDWFTMSGPTFPPHPHAGFSAVTFIFEDSPNGFINRDSIDNVCDIPVGALHWTRASRGLIHEEYPMPGGGDVHGLQIFMNLPAERQLEAPGAFQVRGDEMQRRSGEGWRGRIAVDGHAIGDSDDALPSPVRIEEIHLNDGARVSGEIAAGWGGLLLVIEGQVRIEGGPEAGAYEAVGLKTDDGGQIAFAAVSGPARVVLVTGRRLCQPIYQHGPLILSSPDRLRDRFESLERGEFGVITSRF